MPFFMIRKNSVFHNDEGVKSLTFAYHQGENSELVKSFLKIFDEVPEIKKLLFVAVHCELIRMLKEKPNYERIDYLDDILRISKQFIKDQDI